MLARFCNALMLGHSIFPLTFLRRGKIRLFHSDLQKESCTTPDYYHKKLINERIESLQTVVELAKLSVCLGKLEILTDLNIELSGRTIGLLGPNGAGKSTLILTLLGFCPVTRGSAQVLGYDIRRHIKQVRALVGYMPENDSFIANMTAVSFVCMMGELSGLPAESALERAHEVLFYVGLGEATASWVRIQWV